MQYAHSCSKLRVLKFESQPKKKSKTLRNIWRQVFYILVFHLYFNINFNRNNFKNTPLQRTIEWY
jgi:hypothetical protein